MLIFTLIISAPQLQNQDELRSCSQVATQTLFMLEMLRDLEPRWLIDIKNEQGWGDFLQEPSNVERTADGLDTLLKYRCYDAGEPMSHFWAFSK